VSLFIDAARAILQSKLKRLTDAQTRVKASALTSTVIVGATAIGVAGAIGYGRIRARMRTDNLILRSELASLERRIMESEHRLAELSVVLADELTKREETP
jgi:hypothetical protein